MQTKIVAKLLDEASVPAVLPVKKSLSEKVFEIEVPSAHLVSEIFK